MSADIVITEKSSQARDVRAAVGNRYGAILPAEGHLTSCCKDRCLLASTDDASQVSALLDQIDSSIASFVGDGAYDQEAVYTDVTVRHGEARVVVPPRATAVLSSVSQSAPTQRDRHLQAIAGNGRMQWQKASGYNTRAKIEASIGRYKQVIGDGLRFRRDNRRTTEVAIAVTVMNRMLRLGRTSYIRIA